MARLFHDLPRPERIRKLLEAVSADGKTEQHVYELLEALVEEAESKMDPHEVPTAKVGKIPERKMTPAYGTAESTRTESGEHFKAAVDHLPKKT